MEAEQLIPLLAAANTTMTKLVTDLTAAILTNKPQYTLRAIQMESVTTQAWADLFAAVVGREPTEDELKAFLNPRE